MDVYAAPSPSAVEAAYAIARERYAALGVDTDAALEKLAGVPVSLHCWQGDDVAGFEQVEAASGGGIQATGNYPGRARNADELRRDAEKALSLIPGRHRFNIHAIYAETAGRVVDRTDLRYEHFAGWVEWARSLGLGIDFNPTCFAHPKADDGFTLSHPDPAIRQYWIDHCVACRRIAEQIGRELGSPCVTNLWIPDGFKDTPVDRYGFRKRLMDSLDLIYDERSDPRYNLDAVESKLFGIGSESCVIGSHEFYLGYAVSRDLLLTLDTGHFHPTEVVSDKISSVLLCVEEVLLHVSRGIRWDSDHVVALNEELEAIALEIVRNGFTDRVHIGLDFFDASINRVAAWVIGTRNMIKALLKAFLEPTETLRTMELEKNYTGRLALLEELKTMPFAAVWDMYCLKQNVPAGAAWMREVLRYEREVLAARG